MNDSIQRHIWLHVHVPKAGGSTFRQLLNRNFGKGYYNSTSLLETKQYTRDDVSEIIRCHPWVTCFSDHKLSLDLPYDHPFAAVDVLCFVRNPVERFVSRYFFHRHFEEVQCVAQFTSFQEFIEIELIKQEVHPQTNSQINFLNGGRSNTDLSVIQAALDTGRCHLFPVERFDQACVWLEKKHPDYFPDLSYVRSNVSRKDKEITESERQQVSDFLTSDQPLIELAHQHLDRRLGEVLGTATEQNTAIKEFVARCQKRNGNFESIAG